MRQPNTTPNPTTTRPAQTLHSTADRYAFGEVCRAIHSKANDLELNDARDLVERLLVIGTNAASLPSGIAYVQCGGQPRVGELHHEVTPPDLAAQVRASIVESRELLARLGAGLDALEATVSGCSELQSLADCGSVPS